jgi:ribosomal RNA assembly protein
MINIIVIQLATGVFMDEVYIPAERAALLKADKKGIRKLEKLCGCRLKFRGANEIIVDGNGAFEEYTAKNVIYAFGRGFGIDVAVKLTHPDYYFSSIDIGEFTRNKNRIREIRARLIGTNGRTKKYIEVVSSAKVSIFGDTISFIGKSDCIEEAETAANAIIDGRSHRLAYNKMEAAHRKNKEKRREGVEEA